MTEFISAYQHGVLTYLLVISTIYFLLTLTGLLEMIRLRLTRRDRSELGLLEVSALMPPISILAPAYNEAATIRESVRAMLQISYPQFEVVVINDGSTDETLRLLIEEFRLFRSARFAEGRLATQPVRAVYESMLPLRLVVVDKQNGGKADSLNAGANYAQYPLICCVDSDSLLESDSLVSLAQPFVEDPGRVIAAGGSVRVANGCRVRAGEIEAIGLPESWLARFQVVEYLRAFLGGRVAFGVLNCLMVISGAFGLFLKSAVYAVGGYRSDTVGEDMELVVRLHHWARRMKKDYRIVFSPIPLCWTEVPESLRVLRRQRNRWQRGTIETVLMHRTMFCNPRYGLLGMFAFPFFVAFEMLGPLVELTGYAISAAGWLFGFVNTEATLLFFAAAMLYGIFLSVLAVLLGELTTRPYPGVASMLALIAAAVLENLGFRQLLTVWRAGAFLDLWKGHKNWGSMERAGFQGKQPAGS